MKGNSKGEVRKGEERKGTAVNIMLMRQAPLVGRAGGLKGGKKEKKRKKRMKSRERERCYNVKLAEEQLLNEL